MRSIAGSQRYWATSSGRRCSAWAPISAQAWHHPNATSVTRKRVIRTVVREIVVRVEDDQIKIMVHWQGGDHQRSRSRRTRRVNIAGARLLTLIR